MAETLAPPTTAEAPSQAPAEKTEKTIKRQMIGFSFFKVMPEWRRLPAAERAEHKRLFAEVLARWNQPGRLLSLTY